MTDYPTLWVSATDEQAREIIRVSEEHLQAQLAVALAADQRAIVFAGIAGAMLAAIVGGLIAGWSDVGTFMQVAAVTEALGLSISTGLAIHSGRPQAFHFPGSYPEMWAADVVAGKSAAESRADHIANLDADISGNRKKLDRAGRAVRFALWNFFAAPFYATIFAGVWAAVAAVEVG